MIKKTDQKGAEELKNIYNHYLDKRYEIMNNTQFKFEDVFGVVISKDTFSQEQTTKLNTFFSKNYVNLNIKFIFKFFTPKKKTNIDIEHSAPPEYSDF